MNFPWSRHAADKLHRGESDIAYGVWCVSLSLDEISTAERKCIMRQRCEWHALGYESGAWTSLCIRGMRFLICKRPTLS